MSWPYIGPKSLEFMSKLQFFQKLHSDGKFLIFVVAVFNQVFIVPPVYVTLIQEYLSFPRLRNAPAVQLASHGTLLNVGSCSFKE